MTDHHLDFEPIRNATLRSCLELLAKARHPVEITGLHDAAEACLLSQLSTASSELIVILCATQEQARQLTGDLRFFHQHPQQIAMLPHWEMNPYDALTPHPEIEAQRLATLAALNARQLKALVVPVRALMQRVMPRAVLDGICLTLECDAEYPRQPLLDALLQLGYQPVSLVEERGCFAVRGDLLDLFPADADNPLRIHFFGDYVEKIRPFDAASQRSQTATLERIELIPAREMILHGEFLETLERQLKERCDALSIPRPEREAIMTELREGILAPGRSFLLPLNYPRLDSLKDYLDTHRPVIIDPAAVEQQVDEFQQLIQDREALMRERGEPHVRHESLYLEPAELQFLLAAPQRVECARLNLMQLDDERQRIQFSCFGNDTLRARPAARDDGLDPLIARLRQVQQEKGKALIVCRRQGQAERLQDLIAGHDLLLEIEQQPRLQLPPGQIRLTTGELSSGFCLPDDKLLIISEEDIFGRRSHRRRKSDVKRARQMLGNLAQLKDNDYIVHTEHGIGRYLGLVHLQSGQLEGDFLHLQYADSDSLYLPVERVEKIQKYISAEGHAPRLDKMGGQGWERAKLKARAAVEELARQLLELYARRQLRQGFAFSPPDHLFREFEATFPHEETVDQQQAIDDTLADMQSPRPMDRLVCGDVGYGKTEVAMRAAVKAVLDGKQVAVLVPTTVLARQHWQSFCQRLEDFPVRVDMLSRFRTPADNRKTLEAVAAGKVDILIGTHRLLQRDVRFKDLGLLIVDEEQRFGVAHKEKLKQLRAEVDILTLTATPIPRTLHMSLSGLRDLSVIETAPVDRMAIRTYVTRFDEELIRQAILQELRRGGQVYFVHNRVQTIAAMAEQLRQLVPEAVIGVGHGQMPEKELEQVMLDFVSGRSNVLLASTIIENGLDIPRANTIIINQADHFGLSQLYQLRGRVGRSDRRAYAYLLIPGEAALTREARERLRILQELTELGAGFRIASHDLELRGAGDLLGGKQSGPIAAIGFEMYSELLEETIDRLRGHEREERIDPEIRLGLSAFLPEAYVPDPNQRLQLYQRLAAAEADEQLFDLVDELRDRFGELPLSAQTLISVMRIRVVLKTLWVELLEYDGKRLILQFHAATKISPERIRALVTEQPQRFRLGNDYRLSIDIGRLTPTELPVRTRKELQALL